MQQLIQYVAHMGNDNSIANAARISMDKIAELFTEEENNSLINFLARGISKKDYKERISRMYLLQNDEEAEQLYNEIKDTAIHWTPFAHTALTLRVKAPIPIRTQCFKHKQGLVENEESRRYITTIPELFIPDNFRNKPTESIKQGSAGVHPQSDKWLEIYKTRCHETIKSYEQMINDGVCPEQARLILPQGVMVNWIWTGNLYAFANLYNKRTDSHAQKEIQELVSQLDDIIAPLFPVAWKALTH